MENRIDLTELLKDCPQGMELDCTIFEDVYFDIVSDCGRFIYCYINHEDHRTSISFNKYGGYSNLDKSKCVIFPKGKNTWEGFEPPCKFKDGDIIYNQDINAIAIFYKQTNDNTISHCFLNILGELRIYHYHVRSLGDWRIATVEEKAKLLKVIKDKGYHWNPKTKILEYLPDPIFKIGEVIKLKGCPDKDMFWRISDIKNYQYIFNNGRVVDIDEQHHYELVSNKFNVDSLIPFDKVLVRDSNQQKWEGDIFIRYTTDNNFVVVGGSCWKQCIPYNDDTKHLLGTDNEPDDFLKYGNDKLD